MFGAGGGLLELAAGGLVVPGRVDCALLGGKDESPELVTIVVDSPGTLTDTEPEEAGGGGVSSDSGGAELTGGVG